MNKKHHPDPVFALLISLPTCNKWHILQYVGPHPTARVIHCHLIAEQVDADLYFKALALKRAYEHDILSGNYDFVALIHMISTYRDIIKLFSVTFYGIPDGWLDPYLDMWRLACML